MSNSHIETVQLLVTSRCNLRCQICNIWQFDPSCHDQTLSIEETVDLLEQFSNIGATQVIFSGGEPMLLGSSLTMIVEQAKNLGFKTKLMTNGTLVRRRIVERLVALELDNVSISLDSMDPKVVASIRGEDCRDAVLDAVRMFDNVRRQMGQRRPKIKLNAVMARPDLDDFVALSQASAAAGVDKLDFLKLVVRENTMPWAERWNAVDFASFVAELRHRLDESDLGEMRVDTPATPPRSSALTDCGTGCDLFFHAVTVTPFGDVYPCIFLSDFQNACGNPDAQFRLGNLRNAPLATLLSSNKYRRSKERHLAELKTGQPDSACTDCGVFRPARQAPRARNESIDS